MLPLTLTLLLFMGQAASSQAAKHPVPSKKLIQAAERGELDKLRSLSGDPGLLNPDKRGRTALTAAGNKGQKAAFMELLEIASKESHKEGSRVAKEGQSSIPALMAAVQARMEFFSTPNKEGVTPLMFAARHGWEDAVRTLLADGSPADSVDKEGRSAADYAQAAGFSTLAQTIRSHPKN
jgi:ankyrin repeat protein